MIRRSPTMIPMTDSDIQDIRALVAQQKTTHDARQKMLKMKRITQPEAVAQDAAATSALFPQLEDRLREHDERNRRLGIPPGKSTS